MTYAMLALALLLSGCEMRLGSDQTRFDDLTQRVMKLEKKTEETDANFKAVAQFATETKQALAALNKPKPPEEPKP